MQTSKPSVRDRFVLALVPYGWIYSGPFPAGLAGVDLESVDKSLLRTWHTFYAMTFAGACSS